MAPPESYNNGFESLKELEKVKEKMTERARRHAAREIILAPSHTPGSASKRWEMTKDHSLGVFLSIVREWIQKDLYSNRNKIK